MQLRKLDIRGNSIDHIPFGVLADTALDRIYTDENPVHPVLKQQQGYREFHRRKLARVKHAGWPPEINPNRLKGWGDY